jgi:hypothetical protein
MEYAEQADNRNAAMVATYQSGAYRNLQEVGIF